MARRSKAREVALQMLYQYDLNPDVPAEAVRQQVQERLPDELLSRFAWKLFAGTLEVRAELDAKIEALAVNWTLKRMAPTDRNVLRLGAFELLYSDTPPRVIINEALELVKRYGTAQSSQFLNGILDRLIPAGRERNAATVADPELADADLADDEEITSEDRFATPDELDDD